MKRVISLIMVLAMLIGVMPICADAEELQEVQAEQEILQEVVQQGEQSEETLGADSQKQISEEGTKEDTQEPIPEDDLEEDSQKQMLEEEPEVPAFLTWEEYCYTLLADGSVSICGFDGVPENDEKTFLVEIPSEINGAKVTQIVEKTFAGNGELEAVLLPETIETIGNGIFEDCNNLKVVAFCGEAPSFGDSFAKGAEKLERILILDSSDFTELTDLLKQDLGAGRASCIQFQSFISVATLEEAALTEESDSYINIGDEQTDYGSGLLEADNGKDNSAVPFSENEIDLEKNESIVASGKCGANLTWTLDSNGMLTISGTGAMHGWTVSWDYAIDDRPWGDYREEITSVVITNGVLDISCAAFEGCANLTSVIIPDSVTSIERNAFQGCSLLPDIILPSQLETIEVETFSNCDSLKSISIPNCVTAIGHRAFQGCAKLEKVEMPNSITSLGQAVFCACPSLAEIDLPDGITIIPSYLFEGCTNLKNISIPDKVLEIEARAFFSCKSITEICIPNSVSIIGNGAFDYCENLKSISFPSHMTSIGTYEGCTQLESIIIPDGVTTIEDKMFYDCINLRSVNIPQSVNSIGYWAFDGCSSLTALKIPCAVTSIGREAFSFCSALSEISIPYGVAEIDDRTFYACGKLTKVEIPESVTSIGQYAFSGCSKLNRIDIPDGIVCIENGTFSECSSLVEFHIPESVTTIGEHAFQNCVSLVSINIPLNVFQIGDFAFYSCKNLTRFSVNEENPYYCNDSNGVLFDKNKVTLIQAPNAIKYNYVVPSSVISIGQYAFSHCSNLTSVAIPDSVDSIEASAFSGCTSLTDVYYAGAKEQWTNISMGSNNTYLTDAVFHYENYNSDTGYDGDSHVCYFYKWDAENQIAYFETDPNVDFLNFGCQVTEETDTSFFENVNELVGTYVLAATKTRGDGIIGPGILLSIQSVVVDTEFGVVTDLTGNGVVFIDDTIFQLEDQTQAFAINVGDAVMYHLLDGSLAGSIKQQELSMCGSVTSADADTATISAVQYTISQYASKETVQCLENAVQTGRRVDFFAHDGTIYQARYHPDPYNTPGEEFQPIEPAEGYVFDYRDKWEQAYKEYAEAVLAALRDYAGNSETLTQDMIKVQAEEMKKHDVAEYDKYISVADTKTFKKYEDEAYEALSRYFYEELSSYSVPTLNAIDPKDPFSGAKFVNLFLKNIGNAGKKEYKINGITVEIKPASDIFGLTFGSMTIKENPDLKIVICNSQEDIQATVTAFLEELQSFSKKQTYKAVDIFYQETDALGIYKVSKDFLSDIESKIKKRLGVAWDDVIESAGLGDLMQDLDTCYNYYRFANQAINTLSSEDIQEALKNISELINFEEKTIKDAAVSKAMDKLKDAAKKLDRSLVEYMDGTIVDKENSFWRLFFNCPVNVAVFNSAGEQIGYIGEDDLWYSDGLVIRRVGESKEIVVLTGDLPTFVATATDYGTMSVVLEEYDDGIPTGRLNYYDIALDPGKNFSITPTSDIQADADTLALQSGSGPIYASEYISAEDSAAVNISCAVEGTDGPTTHGAGAYVRGNPVVVYAKPVEGYDFIGWYENGSLVSDSIAYSFTARGDRALTARFRQDVTVYVDVTYGDGGVAIGGGRYNANRIVTVFALPDSGYVFNGWYINSVCVSNAEEYCFEASENVELEAQFMIQMHTHTYSAPEFSWSKDYNCSATFICEDCGLVEIVDCTVSSITTPPTEAEAGKTVYTASAEFSGQTYTNMKTIPIPAADHCTHIPDTKWYSDGENHWHKCTGCDKKLDETKHSGGLATCTEKAVCDVCGVPYGELTPHVYENTWSQGGADGHWHECKNCSAHDTVVPHTPGAAATATTAQTCTVCGYVITPAIGHTHVADSTWYSNGTYHWHLCTSCGAWVSTSQHSYSGDADTTCNACGYIRTINATEPTVETEETVAETEEAQTSENTTVTEALKPTTDDMQENGEVSLSNDGTGNSNSSGVGGILIAALAIIMVGSLAGLVALFIYKSRHGTE